MELSPAVDLYDATASLITAYKYIPCGGLPVFIGRIDELLEPYYHTVSPRRPIKCCLFLAAGRSS